MNKNKVSYLNTEQSETKIITFRKVLIKFLKKLEMMLHLSEKR